MVKFDKNGNEYVIGAYVYYTDVADSSKNDVGVVVEAPAYSAYDEETTVWCRWMSDGTMKCFFTVDGDDSEEFHVITDKHPIPVYKKEPPVMETTEIHVVLHTSNGDVVTTYPSNMIKDATELFMTYVADGKNVTMRNH